MIELMQSVDCLCGMVFLRGSDTLPPVLSLIQKTVTIMEPELYRLFYVSLQEVEWSAGHYIISIFHPKDRYGIIDNNYM